MHRQWELSKHLLITPPLKIRSGRKGNKNAFCAVSFSE